MGSSELFPPNYTIYRKDRTFGQGKGGGVLIATKNDLIATHRADLDGDCEMVWVSLELHGAKQIIIGSFYRSQKYGNTSEYLDTLNGALRKAIGNNNGSQIYLGGDFNLPDIDWGTQSVNPGSQYTNLSNQMLDICNDNGLCQLVSTPTRVNNILDLFFTSNPHLVETNSLIPGISDHDGIPLIVMNSKPRILKQKPRKIYSYHKANLIAIKSDLLNFTNHFINKDSSQCSIDDLYSELGDKIKEVMEAHIPSRMVNKRNTSPWIKRGVRRLQRRKHRAYNSWRKLQTQTALDTFQAQRRETHRATRKSYRKYINSVCTESPKRFWSFMKSIKCDSIGVPSLFCNGKLESNNSLKANILNNQFKDVFTHENNNMPFLPQSSVPTMPNINITCDGITKLLNELNTNKATGPDNIPAWILKTAAAELAPALRLVFQKSLDSGNLPQSWLCANISPIHKKGDRSLASNYRPVSLTSICCKVLEHIIHSQIMNHFNEHSLLTDKQHGFRQKHSCESQLILTVNDLALSLNKRSQIDLIIMDFSKAFDTVPHNRLLNKLHNYGIRNNTHQWIANFLGHRNQRVVVGGEHSTWTNVISGVPQGTVLGPLLFLAYINDLPNNIKSQIRLFADDCVLYRDIQNQFDHEQLQDDLNTLNKWQEDWQLKFNPDKCFSMRLTHSRTPKIYSYELGGHILQYTNNHTYLGIDICNNLSWNKHINRIASSASRSLGFIKRNLYSCPKHIKATAYLTLVRPLLEYSSSVWDPHSQDLINKLERVQRRAARFVVNDYSRHSSVSDMLNQLGWSSLETRRTANRLNTLHKARLGLLSLPIDDLLQPVHRPSRHLHPNAYQLLQTNKDCYKFSFFPRTVKDWNSLPFDLTITDPKLFKNQVLEHLSNATKKD